MLNLAIIGCGKMASTLARHTLTLGRARIAAIHDIDPQRLATACAEFGAEPVEDIHTLVPRTDIDAFLVGSPGLYHHANVLAVAPAGKPIYSEKPLCTTVPLCDEMIETCRRYGAKLFVGQVLRLFPLFWKSHEVIESGVLGAPKLISITRAGRGLHYASGWRSSLAESGGPLLETHAHELDYLLFLLGEPETVFMQGLNLNGYGDYVESLLLQIKFKNGSLGMLHGSNASPIGEYRVHIQCEKGNLLHGGFGGELRYRAFDSDEATVITRDDLSDRPDPYQWELTSFFDWIEKDTPPLFTGETGRANVAVADAAYRSLASGRPESLI